MNSIFTQIASYRDPELIPTLNSLIENSKHAENLTICVCWQHGDDEPHSIFNNLKIKHKISTKEKYKEFDVYKIKLVNGTLLKIIDVHFFKSKGACWARNLIQQQYNNEKYTLQLDSHHRFVENWDEKLIDSIEKLKSIGHQKPLLTAYLPSYDPENDPNGRVQYPWEMTFDRFIPEGAVFFLPQKIQNFEKMNKHPVKARFYSGHFCFTDGIFCNEVQHNPEYFFHGEEISIAARAFTHGYDMFHPTELIAYHEYTRKNRTKIWDNEKDGHTTQNKLAKKIDKDWVERNNECHKLNRKLFHMDEFINETEYDYSKYGFGKARTLREYEEYAGISFKYRGVQQDTLDKKAPPNNYKYSNEDEWKNSFVKSNDIRILLHKKDDLKHVQDDYDFWYVGCHDEEGKEVFRKDAVPSDIKKHLSGNEWVDFRLIWLGNKEAKTYTVWPHSKSKGWMDKITKNI